MMADDLSSFSISLSSKNETQSIMIQCQHLLQELQEGVQNSKPLGQIKDLLSLFQKLKDNISKQRSQLLQLHLNSLQHLQILLFQSDYSNALQKIDQYKRYPLIQKWDLKDLINNNSCQIPSQIDYPEEQVQLTTALKIIQNQQATFEEKQKVWRNFLLKQNQSQQVFQHLQNKDIENIYIGIFQKQFRMDNQITESLLQNLQTKTPDKNNKSSKMLKNKKKSAHQLHSNKRNSNSKSHQKKLNSLHIHESEKKTARKKSYKNNEEIKTAKKQEVKRFAI